MAKKSGVRDGADRAWSSARAPARGRRLRRRRDRGSVDVEGGTTGTGTVGTTTTATTHRDHDDAGDDRHRPDDSSGSGY